MHNANKGSVKKGRGRTILSRLPLPDVDWGRGTRGTLNIKIIRNGRDLGFEKPKNLKHKRHWARVSERGKVRT